MPPLDPENPALSSGDSGAPPAPSLPDPSTPGFALSQAELEAEEEARLAPDRKSVV